MQRSGTKTTGRDARGVLPALLSAGRERRRATTGRPSRSRCPHCRLLIGEGRAKDTADASPGARGTAAGVFAHRAKRDDKEPASADDVCEAIRTVARELGARPERLLMVDYQQHASGDPSLPELSDVFAAFGSWKRARREAAAGA